MCYLTIADVLRAIHTRDYSAWETATLKTKWELLKEAEAAGRLREIAIPLGILGRWDCKVTIGAELNRRANPDNADRIAAWLR